MSKIVLDLGCLDIWAKFAKEAREGGVAYDVKKFHFSSCGWPVNAHRDFSSAATVFFK